MLKIIKKYKNIIFLIIIAFIVTGCDVNYNLVITDKKEVVETSTVLADNSYILRYNDDINVYFNNQINTYQDIAEFKNYAFNKNVGQSASSLTLKKKYNSLNDYKSSPFFTDLFNDAQIVTNKNYTTFNTVGYNYSNLFGVSEDPTFYIGQVSVKIKFYNGIVDSNADFTDKKNNTLEWRINANDKDKSIYFKINNEKRYDIIIMDFIINSLQNIIIISVSLLLIVAVSAYIYLKLKHNNKV